MYIYIHYIYKTKISGPDRMAEWVERPSSAIEDLGIRTHWFEPWSSQTNDLKTNTSRFLARRSAYYGRANVRIMWLSGAGSLVSPSGSTIKSLRVCIVINQWCDYRCCQDVKLQQPSSWDFDWMSPSTEAACFINVYGISVCTGCHIDPSRHPLLLLAIQAIPPSQWNPPSAHLRGPNDTCNTI